MSDDGKAINQMFVQTRKFFGEVAKLLQAADEPMVKSNWKPNDAKLTYSSGAIDKAENWLPYYATRFYSNEGAPESRVYVSVLLDYYDGDKVEKLEQPMISCGAMHFRSKDELEYWPWHGALHLYQKGWSADGKVVEFEPRQFMAASYCKAVHVACSTVPLVSITTSDELAKRCIHPLLEFLARGQKTESPKVG